jgi:hypothetical protein
MIEKKTTLLLENRREKLITTDNIDMESVKEKGLFNPIYIRYVFDVGNQETEAGHCTFVPMPGCCGVIISTELWIEPKYRGRNYNKIFFELRKELAKKLGYSKILATIRMDNIPEVVACAKYGWHFIETFTNKRTNNLLALIEINL